MDKSQKPKNLQNIRRSNVLESLKDIGGGTSRSLKNDLLKASSEEFLQQLFGAEKQKYSGEITPGETLELTDVFTGDREEKKKQKVQMAFERSLLQEENRRIEEKGNQLKLQLHALMQEVYALAQSTQGLGEEIEVASMQAPVNPGVYHIVFFEKLLDFVKSFRKKIDNAGIWMHASNRRAEKKNFWSIYKKHGSKFLLSPDHYLQRSAG
ncbi:hypothetical protein A2V61_01495 [Candidatus Woesebacteria bacterium RBG_19FT_COMBO_47_8]|uniref:DUF5660 domain-containing protein n=1 Tax=Candidatus Woesebacteria bacterium RBG_13_46_13 TaxID=1802479 RepID=A0A1F7X427_9BACT|nr:MAG: hypothetical protein A2Y68_03290 [Candidatus Woesebacteria bacterium RBG_13_46_13]OGM17199.1 MAG: hypothetical protein A2V61_01495 [Candidatus Woesebacteria bacterium RBG_19FT_COMBO_47_8]HJX59586.1 DUF5660 family protein [Patescibacteria group bacterium]